jgi:hypothetical protein
MFDIPVQCSWPGGRLRLMDSWIPFWPRLCGELGPKCKTYRRFGWRRLRCPRGKKIAIRPLAVSVDEASKMLGVSSCTLRRRVADGEIVPFAWDGGCLCRWTLGRG